MARGALATIEQGLKRTNSTHDRLKGVAGWLLTEPMYLSEINALKVQWLSLPSTERPAFPLTRPIRMAVPHVELVEAGSDAASFAARLATFLDKWGVTRLATWDLPDPQGPIVPDLMPPNAQARPSHGIHLFVPLHYPLQGDDELVRKVQELQRQVARQLDVDDSMAGLPHYRAYAAMFDIIHLERTIRSRFPDDRRRAGLVEAIEFSAASVLNYSVDNIKKRRKAIAQCRRGGRSQIKWLQSRRS